MKKFHTDTEPSYIKYLTGYDAEQLYPDQLFPELTAGRFQFVLKFHNACTRAAYIGASWRGLLGHALLETQCPFLIQTCDPCNLKRSCAYYCLYEFKSEEKGFSNVPRPYVIFPSGGNGREGETSVDMTLMHKGRLLKEQDWFAAFKSLAVRVSALSRYYCDTPRLDNSVWNMLISFFFEFCKTYNCISWKLLKRYSSRQKKYVPPDGIIGECMVAPEGSRSLWWQWWQMAALFHLGKGTTMGLGKVKVSLT